MGKGIKEDEDEAGGYSPKAYTGGRLLICAMASIVYQKDFCFCALQLLEPVTGWRLRMCTDMLMRIDTAYVCLCM